MTPYRLIHPGAIKIKDRLFLDEYVVTVRRVTRETDADGRDLIILSAPRADGQEHDYYFRLTAKLQLLI